MGEGVKIRNVQDVAAWRLCLGCGACFGVCSEGGIRLVDVEDDGIRPFVYRNMSNPLIPISDGQIDAIFLNAKLCRKPFNIQY